MIRCWCSFFKDIITVSRHTDDPRLVFASLLTLCRKSTPSDSTHLKKPGFVFWKVFWNPRKFWVTLKDRSWLKAFAHGTFLSPCVFFICLYCVPYSGFRFTLNICNLTLLGLTKVLLILDWGCAPFIADCFIYSLRLCYTEWRALLCSANICFVVRLTLEVNAFGS